jgi:predicted transposase YbfD/YdcC
LGGKCLIYIGTEGKLIDIATIALCAVICGADAWEDIEEFGTTEKDWFEQFLARPHGIPGHDTFASMDPKQFQRAFLKWAEAVQEVTAKQIVAIDGKTLRRSHGKGKSPLHLVSAWACRNKMILGQVKTREKSNEITAIPELLNILELEGCMVIIDAMGCQKEILKTIIDKGADYVLGLKGNQGTLHDDVQFYFEDCRASGFKNNEYDYHETIDGDHGRIETRRYWTTADIHWLADTTQWKNLASIVMVERERMVNDTTSEETSYYVTSLKSDAARIARAVRGHWGVENSLHWVPDVVFREDESRIRKDNAPATFVGIRHMALNLLRKETSLRRGIKAKRLKAGWDKDYLKRILQG